MSETDTPAAEPAKTGSGWFTFFGILAIIAGVIAIMFPLVSSIAIKLVIGWTFLFFGIGYLIHAFSAAGWKGKLMDVLLGILFIIVGGWLAFNILEGLIALTIMISASFIVQGIVEIGASFQMKPEKGWGWFLFSGIIAVVAGVMIFLGLPSTAAWALGLLAGVNMITSGMSFLALASAMRAAA
ncbi:HdeD family acid-resistance protein [Oceanomicrobium pacificus]|uniref:HdeD family acid-resistance protein n=1 Tax=Oceanomicrobium pacificus TaxID=2692916 RepID=A0A6B0TRW7_9RHOB|nr:HdeD family acid-resistance protein [Oceanomicrobium pacificus]MXU65459.1 HdeD family acid-resistance protein [Oceanomicrobium pacificus]